MIVPWDFIFWRHALSALRDSRILFLLSTLLTCNNIFCFIICLNTPPRSLACSLAFLAVPGDGRNDAPRQGGQARRVHGHHPGEQAVPLAVITCALEFVPLRVLAVSEYHTRQNKGRGILRVLASISSLFMAFSMS